MPTGTVSATNLNLRDAPDGAVLITLPRGTTVNITNERDGWLEVDALGRHGFVSSRHVERGPAAAAAPRPAASAVPPEAREHDIVLSGKDALGPGGIKFGRLHRLGLFNVGHTSIGTFLDSNDGTASLGSSNNIMRAVSDNEGKLEAINTWDNSFLSFGVYQWTAGQDGGPGELASVLDHLKTVDAQTYEKYFGTYGLQPVNVVRRPGALATGFLQIGGRRLDTVDAKEELRKPIWAYRFWRAGHDRSVRSCQVAQAADRISAFYRIKRAELGNHSIADFVSSEYGVALLLDQHVNRPGHVVQTVARSLAQYAANGGARDPANWRDEDESRLLKIYLEQRKQTNMTDSQKRADVVDASVRAGRLATGRNSFA
jgi:hypothetical protein